eukprot:TRINITY_DN6532_c0_g1::TRINITY_DN6532_c0_g1_i1::g.13427::m.13427 TRINITY_DN6532_c0_g1::TRINITY_DN6532_c0_g1_i1::g.13427  ORF type:complete len:201 (+),score=23.97,sp/Q9ERR2/COMD5_RAT/31.47/7e-17,HCaRG/PF07258.9/5.6e-23 TRINITY_DN6532_c0_g1_i1:76-678(+)
MSLEAWVLGSSSTPFEVSKALPLLQKLDIKDTEKILAKVVAYLKGNIPAHEDIASLIPNDQDTSITVFTGLYFLIRASLRVTLKESQLVQYLKDLSIPESHSSLIIQARAACGNRFSDFALKQRVSPANIVDFSWRVDVVITTTNLSLVKQPCIVCQLRLSDGSIESFEMSVERFHEFRFTLASLLKDVHRIEQQSAVIP